MTMIISGVRVVSTTKKGSFRISYALVRGIIDTLRIKYKGTELFGREKDKSIHGCINTIYQSFSGVELYPSIEDKAANLLYFLVKDHPFIDGNKRIAAFLFVWFLDKNNILYKVNGEKKVAGNALGAITLMIAESKPNEREMIIKIATNLINKTN